MQVSPCLATSPSPARIAELDAVRTALYRQWAADYAVESPVLAQACAERADLLQLRLEAYFR